ncbi:major facilitator superfamily transporter [Colletotrichum karsti]|uniref:Major facilitator superfamily transporter n=1 Tax=Colletotrichum karsti TaxID=1095194 RepID=A0A9P6HVV5_9PEZI|nr:major facilitator superfamily transporter [Colletotrichum karsti]KAF9871329.1 major facilitator superfamily transporter [Colletotrichum karsti]
MCSQSLQLLPQQKAEHWADDLRRELSDFDGDSVYTYINISDAGDFDMDTTIAHRSSTSSSTETLVEPIPTASDDDMVIEMPTWRKWTTLFVICWMTLPATFASSSIMTAVAEVAAEFHVSTQSTTAANAGVFIAMAVSALIWLPISTFIGRRAAYLLATIMLALCSIGSALSQSFAVFTTIWIIGGTTGLYFLIAGQTILADIFEPTTRGMAVGLFLGSSVAANSLAPLVGGIIVSYASWRVIYVVQAAITFFGLLMALLFIPNANDVNHKQRKTQPPSKSPLRSVLGTINPMGVFRLFKHPKIITANIACGLLGFNQYGLIASVRRVINPRFNLTSPLISGIFYLAPGAGFLLGSMIGGALSDRTVKQYIRMRSGQRLPQDRLNSSLPALFVVLPIGTLAYGWSLQGEIGGIPLLVISSFVQGFGLMWSFSGLNTYAAEVLPEQRTAVISGKYIVQYFFAASAVGGVVPLIDAIGVGWAFTITGLGVTLAGVLVLIIIKSASTEHENHANKNANEKDAEKKVDDDWKSFASTDEDEDGTIV